MKKTSYKTRYLSTIFNKVILFTLMINAISNFSYAAKDTLIYCSPTAPEGFDTAIYASIDTSDAAAYMIFNRLVQVDQKTGAILPELATSWTKSEDGHQYTFKLNKNVYFHQSALFTRALEKLQIPARALNADDVAFTFNRMIDKENFFHKIQPHAYPGLGITDLATNIKKIEKIDDETITFTLEQPNNSFLYYLASAFASIQSEQYVKGLVALGVPEKLNQNPIGTGPFIFQNYQKDSAIRYRSNTQYFKGEPKLKHIIFSITPDATVRTQKIISGECDLISHPPQLSLAKLKTKPQLKIETIPALSLGYLSINTNKVPALKDARVRHALSYAIDRKAILKELFYNNAVLAGSVVPATHPLHEANILPHSLNLDKARALLKEAGFENGFDIEIWAIPTQRAAQPNGKRLAEMLQHDWAKIGINGNIRSSDWAEYIKLSRAGDYLGISTMSASSSLAPDSFLNWLRCSAIGTINFAQWCHPKFDDLLHQAQIAKTETERVALIHEAQKIIEAEAPVIPLVYPTNHAVHHQRVKNFDIQADGSLRLESVFTED